MTASETGGRMEANNELPSFKLENLLSRWKTEKPQRDFFALVCETIGPNKEMYKKLTDEMIAKEAEKRKKEPADPSVRLAVISEIGRSFDKMIYDPVFKIDPKKREVGQASMVVWLDLLREMRDE
jgi:hypothetical protein